MTATCPCCGARIDPGIAANELPRTQAAVFLAMAESFGRFVKTPTIIARAWADDPTGGPECAFVSVSAAIRKMKPTLAKHGLAVESRQGLGYRLKEAA